MNIPQLTFTRFIAAFSVVIYHYGQEIFPFSLPWFNQLFSIANIGVSYFFLLSGFILATVYYEKEKNKTIKKSEFYVLRIARIYPLYLISLLSILLPKLYFTSNWEILRTTPFMIHISLLQSWFPKYTMKWNFPAWSLSVELFFYLLFPFIIKLFTKLSNYKTSLIIIIFWFLNLCFFVLYIDKIQDVDNQLLNKFILFNPLSHLNTFIFGVGAGIIFIKLHSFISTKTALLFLSISIILCITFVFIPSSLLKYYHNGMMSPIFTMFLIGLSSNYTLLAKLFAKRFLEVLGEISYSIYILQEPIRVILYNYINIEMLSADKTLLFYLYLFTLILTSFLTFYLIEKPVRNFIKFSLITRLKKVSY